MPYNIIKEDLNGIKLIEPKIFSDNRGYFFESFNQNDFEELGITETFVQDNQSSSKLGTIRGIHFQYNNPQGKLERVLRGTAIFRIVDIRIDSPFFGQYREYKLSEENKLLLWVPKGFGNSFSAESEEVVIHYKCTNFWDAKSEISILYNDKDIGINWNNESPKVSDKDLNGISLKQWKEMNIKI